MPVAAKPAPSEVAMAQLLAERRCLTQVMYYEARGEGVRGEMAVAEVVFHRMRSRAYPSTICNVVFEGAQEKRACQFSFVIQVSHNSARYVQITSRNSKCVYDRAVHDFNFKF